MEPQEINTQNNTAKPEICWKALIKTLEDVSRET